MVADNSDEAQDVARRRDPLDYGNRPPDGRSFCRPSATVSRRVQLGQTGSISPLGWVRFGGHAFIVAGKNPSQCADLNLSVYIESFLLKDVRPGERRWSNAARNKRGNVALQRVARAPSRDTAPDGP